MLHERRVRNRYRFSGTGFWRRFLVSVLWALRQRSLYRLRPVWSMRTPVVGWVPPGCRRTRGRHVSRRGSGDPAGTWLARRIKGPVRHCRRSSSHRQLADPSPPRRTRRLASLQADLQQLSIRATGHLWSSCEIPSAARADVQEFLLQKIYSIQDIWTSSESRQVWSNRDEHRHKTQVGRKNPRC